MKNIVFWASFGVICLLLLFFFLLFFFLITPGHCSPPVFVRQYFYIIFLPPFSSSRFLTCHHHQYRTNYKLNGLRNDVNVGRGGEPHFPWMLEKQLQLRICVFVAALASLLALPKPALKSLNSTATMDATFTPRVHCTRRTCYHNHYLSKDELDDLRNNVNVGFGEELNFR